MSKTRTHSRPHTAPLRRASPEASLDETPLGAERSTTSIRKSAPTLDGDRDANLDDEDDDESDDGGDGNRYDEDQFDSRAMRLSGSLSDVCEKPSLASSAVRRDAGPRADRGSFVAFY